MYVNQEKVKVNDLVIEFYESEFEVISSLNFEDYPLLKKYLNSKKNIVPSNFFDAFWGEIDKFLESENLNLKDRQLLINISNYFSLTTQFSYE